MSDELKAKVDKVGDKYRILVTKDGESLYLGNKLDGLLFRYVEYDTEFEAIDHIKKSEKLILNTTPEPPKDYRPISIANTKKKEI